jgi:hypothetical protein
MPIMLQDFAGDPNPVVRMDKPVVMGLKREIDERYPLLKNNT